MFTIGLDVHLSRTSVCVLDGRGNILRQQEVIGGHDAVAGVLGKIKKPFQVCFEASTGYGALYERIEPLAEKVAVAHPGKLQLIYQSKKKHNRADAQKLATLMHLNVVPAEHVPAQEVRSWRGLIEHRRNLVDQSVALKNQVRALLRGQGIRGPAGRKLWTKAGLAWLKEVSWPTEVEAFRLEILLEEAKEIQEKIDRVTGVLDEKAGKDARVHLLMTIPGVGMRTAVTEAGWRGASISARVKEVFERHRKGDPDRRKLAIVATGHWLCRVMLAMLKKGEAFGEREGVAAVKQTRRCGTGGVMPLAGSLVIGKSSVANARVTPPPVPALGESGGRRKKGGRR